MKSDRVLRTAIDFAQADLRDLTKRERIRFQRWLDALREFRAGGVLLHASMAMTAAQIRKLQGELRELFIDRFAIYQAEGIESDDAGAITAPVPIECRVGPFGRGFLISGSHRDVTLAAILFLLSQEPEDKVLVCPECARVFYRVRKQRYCSRFCVNKATNRAWRMRNKPATREAAHRQYAKKVQATSGGKAKRRPRKSAA